MRRALAKGYGMRDLQADLLSGLLVGVVALPLSMALSIAVGAPPQHGLYTAIVAGFSVALLGGCKFQVTGPTAAFVVVLAPILTRYGLSGLLTAGFLSGILLVAMGAFRLGNLISYIPYPVTTGFTTGIAAVIATLQVKDFFGLSVASMPDSYVEKVSALLRARGTVRPLEFGVAAATLLLLLVLPRLTRKVPAPLLALALVTATTFGLRTVVPGFSVETIGSRFHSMVDGVEVFGIPRALPAPSFPILPWAVVRDLLSPALAIAMLGAIESLLSAVIADGMTGTRHDPNSELVALGIGNILAPVFGGIAATGALARTATNIRAGARSPIAAAFHAVVVLLAILLLAGTFAWVPMASLSALLLLVAWNMSEARHFVGMIRFAPKSDIFVLLACFGLTVFFDMVVAVSVGFVLAAVLFMHRMSELTHGMLRLGPTAESEVRDTPPGVALYEINGPLFFGAAQKAMQALATVRGSSFRVLVLCLGKVPVIDATGFVALENAIVAVLREKKSVVLAGPLPAPSSMFERAALDKKHPRLSIEADLDSALARARTLLAEVPVPSQRPSR